MGYGDVDFLGVQTLICKFDSPGISWLGKGRREGSVWCKYLHPVNIPRQLKSEEEKRGPDNSVPKLKAINTTSTCGICVRNTLTLADFPASDIDKYIDNWFVTPSQP